MNVLGIDHGTKRIGLAIGSTETGTAAPLSLLTHRGDENAIEDIKAIVVAEAIEQVVVGMPFSTDGGHAAQEDVVRHFAARLANVLSIPVALQDERLSSREIEAHMQALGGKKAWKASGLDRDSASAVIFLQSYLDRLRNQ